MSDRWTNFELELDQLAMHTAEQKVFEFKNAMRNGQLLHPHFEELSGDIAELLRTNTVDTIEAAYQRALKGRGIAQH